MLPIDKRPINKTGFINKLNQKVWNAYHKKMDDVLLNRSELYWLCKFAEEGLTEEDKQQGYWYSGELNAPHVSWPKNSPTYRFREWRKKQPRYKQKITFYEWSGQK